MPLISVPQLLTTLNKIVRFLLKRNGKFQKLLAIHNYQLAFYQKLPMNMDEIVNFKLSMRKQTDV